MSTMDDTGDADTSADATATAASEHVQTMDGGELGDHLTQSLGNMDKSTLMGLGQQLLSTYTNHPSYTGDANSATQEAGVSQAAVASGDPGAIGMLINLAKNNPGILQSAAGSFLGKNPGAVGSLAPGLLQGIMGRLGGR